MLECGWDTKMTELVNLTRFGWIYFNNQKIKLIIQWYHWTVLGSRKFCHRGSYTDNVYFIYFSPFFGWWGEERGSKHHLKWATIGPPAKRNLNDLSLAGQWWPNIECWLGSFVIFQGIRTSIAKEPYSFVTPGQPSESAHVDRLEIRSLHNIHNFERATCSLHFKYSPYNHYKMCVYVFDMYTAISIFTI